MPALTSVFEPFELHRSGCIIYRHRATGAHMIGDGANSRTGLYVVEDCIVRNLIIFSSRQIFLARMEMK